MALPQVLQRGLRNFFQGIPVHLCRQSFPWLAVPLPEELHGGAQGGLPLGQRHDAGVAQEGQNRSFHVNAAFSSLDPHLVSVEPSVIARGSHTEVLSARVVQVTLQESGHQLAPTLQVHDASLKEKQVAHVGGHALCDVAQFRGARVGKVVGHPFGRTNALHIPSVVQFVAGNANDFHVSLF